MKFRYLSFQNKTNFFLYNQFACINVLTFQKYSRYISCYNNYVMKKILPNNESKYILLELYD